MASEPLVPSIEDRINFFEELEKLKKGVSAPSCQEQEQQQVHGQEVPEGAPASPGNSTSCVPQLTWCDLEGYRGHNCHHSQFEKMANM
ncbi:hypothetical protein E2C01_044432 [Portunus trituberculatus]|uniref:Uncharacterized protein n=1 Tax=Portunus trituberculatus TaxID=210409 RepID=A0A5B7G017_PORTR|nr:hypothetical protein [Portunus trituberculatus]